MGDICTSVNNFKNVKKNLLTDIEGLLVPAVPSLTISSLPFHKACAESLFLTFAKFTDLQNLPGQVYSFSSAFARHTSYAPTVAFRADEGTG